MTYRTWRACCYQLVPKEPTVGGEEGDIARSMHGSLSRGDVASTSGVTRPGCGKHMIGG